MTIRHASSVMTGRMESSAGTGRADARGRMQMKKRWSLMMPCAIVLVAVFGRLGHVQAAPAAGGERIVVTSANDPTRPVPGGVRWFWRMHNDYVQQTRNRKFDLCFLGDSITQAWPGDLFGRYYGKYNAVNFGIGGTGRRMCCGGCRTAS